MNIDWRGLMVFLGLAAVAATSWYSLNDEEESESETPPVQGEAFSYYIRGASISGFDINGSMLYELNADYIYHDASDDSISLENVRMDYQPSPAASWLVEADEGRMDGGREYLDLLGNVKAQRTRQPGALKTVLHTSTLRLEPETSVATSSAEVQLEMSGRTLSGTGMYADLRQERLQLKANVHGRFSR